MKELGIAPWKFYEYKARYAAEEMLGSIDGAFLQLAGNSEITGKGTCEFEKWMEKAWETFPPQSRCGKAISYTYSLLPRLSRYVNDGRIHIDNNLIKMPSDHWL